MFFSNDIVQVKGESNQIRYKSMFFLFHLLKDYPEVLTYTFNKNL